MAGESTACEQEHSSLRGGGGARASLPLLFQIARPLWILTSDPSAKSAETGWAPSLRTNSEPKTRSTVQTRRARAVFQIFQAGRSMRNSTVSGNLAQGLGGMMSISTNDALSRVPAGLPIFITGGAEDPVGGRKGMTALAKAYEATGHTAVTLKLYDEGRHEMFNETNRDEVVGELLEWLSARLP